MFGRWILCLALPVTLVACVDLTTTDQNSTSGGNSSSGGSGICATGENLKSLGDSGTGATNGIVSDASGVYWVNDAGTVWHAGPGGASPTILAKNLGTLLYTIATDDQSVYVIDNGVALYQIDKNGGAPNKLAEGSFQTLAVDALSIYLTQTDGLYRLDKPNGQPQLIAAITGAGSLAVDDNDIFVRVIGSSPNAQARVVRVPKTGGMPVDVVPSEPTAYHYFSEELAIDASFVYWVHPSAGTVSRAPKGGGNAEILASGVADPVSITVDDSFVYFTVRGKDGGSLDDRAVAKVPKTGGAITYIAHGPQVSAYGIAVDETNAYWTQRATGGVVETACK